MGLGSHLGVVSHYFLRLKPKIGQNGPLDIGMGVEGAHSNIFEKQSSVFVFLKATTEGSDFLCCEIK
jgi:hypothetical protein